MIKFYIFFAFSCIYAAEFSHEEEKTNSFYLEKLNAAKCEHLYPDAFNGLGHEEIRRMDQTFDCSIHGFYLFYKGEVFEGDIKIGIVSLSNAEDDFYKNNAALLGFTSGEYVCRNIFLEDGHKGKGYFKHIHAKVMELITPFIGKTHLIRNNAGDLVNSDLPFQGTRGLISRTNIPSLSAALKAGATLINIPEEDQWVVQYPAPNRDLTVREIELRRVADLIIKDSLDSFRPYISLPGDNEILSTERARDAFQTYFSENELLKQV